MKVQGKAILVLPDENPDKTEGGIIIPLDAKKPSSGKVVDCGPGCELVKPGDRVQYHRGGASVISIEEVDHHFIIEDHIFYIH
jgi:co-chaperonin GroES (HSP10)